MNTTEFPTFERVKLAVEIFRQRNWPEFCKGTEVSEYLRLISNSFLEHLNILPDICQVVKVSNWPFKLFRAREFGSFDNINIIGEHSYCPISLTTNLGRCHFPKFPVFYCSNNPLTALLEIVKNDNFKNSTYCISVWQTIITDDELVVQPFLFGDLHADNVFNKWRETLLNQLNEPFGNQLSPDQLKGLSFYLEFMADLFVNSDDYSISAFFSHRRIYSPHKIKTDVLIFPSVQTRYKGVNMAINPNFVDKSLFPSRFYIIEITDINKDDWEMSFNCTSYGILTNYQIHWKRITPDDELYQKYFQKDFGYNGDFNITKTTP